MPPASLIDAVVFDIGGVFGIRDPDSVSAALAHIGIDLAIDDELAHRAHYAAARHLASFDTDYGRNVEIDAVFWGQFEHRYLEVVGVHAMELERVRDAFLSPAPDAPRPAWNMVLYDNITSFHRIAVKFPTAIVSNNDGGAEQQMRDIGICQVGPGPLANVAAIVDSAVIGIAKPDPRIFLPALAALGTDPARTLYVGDTVHADIRGATAAGMASVQLDPYDLYDGFAHSTIRDVTALADYLGC
jgi:putative hydrolase of the HAD superfamily